MGLYHLGRNVPGSDHHLPPLLRPTGKARQFRIPTKFYRLYYTYPGHRPPGSLAAGDRASTLAEIPFGSRHRGTALFHRRVRSPKNTSRVENSLTTQPQID